MRSLTPLWIALSLAAGCGPAPWVRDTSADACPPEPPALAADAGTHALKTVFLIVLENKNWSQIAGSPSAPYINGTLLPQFAHAIDYRNGGLEHSLPSYIELEAADPLGVYVNFESPVQMSIPVTCHLSTWVEQVGLTWKSYQEGISGTDCPIHRVGKYAPRHNPFVYFEDVSGNPPATTTPTCIEHVRPYSELAADLAAGTVARYNFITPDLCHSGHDYCAPTMDPVRQEDDWLAAEIPKIMASQAWLDGGVILVTWDEGKSGNPPIGLLAISPLAKAGYAGAIPYGHPSTVRTVQEILGLTPLLRRAATAASLSDLFVSYP